MSDASNFEKMVAEFKDLAELQNYCNAQNKTIIELTKKLNAANELKDVPMLVSNSTQLIQFPMMSISPEEEICLKQLHDLNITSKNSTLTLEDCKKVEIFTKILMSIRNKTKDVDASSKHLSDDELLKLAGNGEAT